MKNASKKFKKIEHQAGFEAGQCHSTSLTPTLLDSQSEVQKLRLLNYPVPKTALPVIGKLEPVISAADAGASSSMIQLNNLAQAQKQHIQNLQALNALHAKKVIMNKRAESLLRLKIPPRLTMCLDQKQIIGESLISDLAPQTAAPSPQRSTR